MLKRNFKNLKNGQIYHILYTARNVSDRIDKEVYVYYRQSCPDVIYVRNVDEFHKKFIEI